MELGLKNRTALVCGASKGIGRGIALALAREGVHLALIARGAAGLAEAADLIRAECDVDVVTLPADLADSASVKAAIAELRGHPRFATLNILINNAGVPVTRADRQILWDDDDWRELIEIKTLGALRTIREALPLMARDGSGRIVNITGASGTAVWQPAMMHGLTNASLIHTTGYLAADLWAERITVNAIVPGLVGTEYREQWMAEMARDNGREPGEQLAGFCKSKGIFMERWADVEEVADLALFLASDRAAYINGARIAIDGGLSLNIR